MAQRTKIEWTDATWNPVTGCSKISIGCQNCYAERIAIRLQSMDIDKYANGFDVSIHENVLGLPLSWKKARMVFVNSMSDIFHEDITDTFVKRIFHVMYEAYWHTFQVLTKRANRMEMMCNQMVLPLNVWLGVTVETSEYVQRIEFLRNTNAIVRFISFEPLLSRIGKINLDGIHWVIVGGESGPNARPMESSWVQEIRDQCIEQQVAFFFKQWGDWDKTQKGNVLDGLVWNELPFEHQQQAGPELCTSYLQRKEWNQQR